MAARSISETQRVRYLLGLSSTEERERIESEYFADDDAFQKMVAAEDDLIDAYARGELVDEERRSFEMNFVRSFDGRERVQFARAFASATRPVRTGTWLKIFTSARLSQTATIATIIVLVVALAWLGIELRKTSNELRELRAESAELSKRTEALQRSSDKQTHTEEIAPPDLRAQPDKPKPRERTTTAPQRAALDVVSVGPSNTYLLTQRNASSRGSTVRGTITDPSGNFVTRASVTLTNPTRNFTRTKHTTEGGAYVFDAVPPGNYTIEVQASGFKTASASGVAVLVNTPTIRDLPLEIGNVSETVNVTSAAEAAIKTSDATLGNTFESRRITELPLNANNVAALLSLQPGNTRTDFVSGGRTDQSNITLDGVDINIGIPGFANWTRFQIGLQKALIHDHCRIIIKTADGRPVTSIDWIEPLTPNQTTIDTPAIVTGDLPAGDYVLELLGKEPNGSFVKLAEYSFKLIK